MTGRASWFVFCISTFAFCVSSTAAEPATKTLLLLGQKPDGHPPGTHEYVRGMRILKHLLDGTPGLKITLVSADDPWTEGPELLAKADGVAMFVSQGAAWMQADPRRYEAFARFAQRGGGIAAFHWALGTKEAANIDRFVRLAGACHGGPDRKYQVLDARVELPTGKHSILAGLAPFALHEEFYFRLKRAPAEAGTLTPLATIPVDGAPEMVGWALERADGGRSFGYTGLHFHDNWRRPEYRRLMAQGVLWTLGLPIPKEGVATDVSEELLRLE